MATDTAASAEADPVRVVEVRSPSIGGETRAVVIAILHVVFWSALVIGAEYGEAHRHDDDPGRAKVRVNYDEVAFAAMPAEDQRLFGLIREGVAAIEQDRGRTGVWPEVDALAGRFVPPFAPDPIDRGGYRWTRLQDGSVVDYVGTPAAGSGRATFVIVFIEPGPGTPIDPTAPIDEVHHRLSDGTSIHVMIWRVPDGRALTTATELPPAEDGWRRVSRAM